MRFIWMTFLLFFFLNLIGQSNTGVDAFKSILKEGDILFQDLDCGDLCDAIETVTEGVNDRDFSHCAIVTRQEGSLYVIEAISAGVVLTALDVFLKRSGDDERIQNVVVGRLDKMEDNKVEKALKYAKSLIGSQYDDVYILGDDKYYCSELVYEAFKHANDDRPLFLLNKMTFKDPLTEEFFPAWVEYYKSLDTPIPEGKWGINPGAISRDLNIRIVD